MKMMAKAAASIADEVIFDLEDACPPSKKELEAAISRHVIATTELMGTYERTKTTR